MAGPIDPADYDAAPGYGGQRKMREALSKLLAAKDPRGAKKQRQNGSNARGQMGVLRQVAASNPLLLLQVFSEPLKQERKRLLATERQRRRRERLRREGGL